MRLRTGFAALTTCLSNAALIIAVDKTSVADPEPSLGNNNQKRKLRTKLAKLQKKREKVIAGGGDLSAFSIEEEDLIPKSKLTLDMGILKRTTNENAAPVESERHLSDGSACTAGYVEYVNGSPQGGVTCGTDCCVGTSACTGFSGHVCKDGSCSGNNACDRATIPHVVASCYDGDQSCKFAGGSIGSNSSSGNVGNILRSCRGFKSCYAVGLGERGQGSTGNVVDSCIGSKACYSVGEGWGEVVGEHSQGAAGNVYDSCLGIKACYQVGAGWGSNSSSGNVGNILRSCRGSEACINVGHGQQGQGSTGNVVDSCIGSKACYSVGEGWTDVVGDHAQGSAGNVYDSCIAIRGCYGVGAGWYDGGHGSVGDIEGSCNAGSACEYAGYNSVINSSLLTCCNCKEQCEGATEASALPAECSDAQQTVECPSEMPSSQPSSQPSEAPSSQPSSQPSGAPSSQPSETPSSLPSSQPSKEPSSQPAELPSSSPSEHPSESPSCTPSSSPTEADTVYLYYPDWNVDGCRNDGNEPNYMSANPSAHLFSTLAMCCMAHFSWNYLSCMGQLENICARSLFYPDWEGADKGCLDDGNEPSYMKENPTQYMYASKVDCCQQHYNWIYIECVGAKQSANNGLYYPDFDGSDHICRNNGLQPMYMDQSPQWWMHEDLKECCTTNYSWNYEACIKSDPNAAPVANPDVDGKYFPDWLGTGAHCKNDGTQPPYMTKNPSMWMYDSLDDCCQSRYSWNYDACRGQTSGGTGSGVWFKNDAGNCVESDTGNGVHDEWDTTYTTKKKCCKEAKWWDEDCEDN